MACGTEETDVTNTEPQPVPIVAEVAVTGGVVRGTIAEDGLKQYHGIPYAAAPTGERRWAPPQPVEPWTAPRDASQPGPACMQPQGVGGALYGQSGFAMDEDCLTLNVWTRAAHVGDGLPVMVWIHGGGLTTGSGSTYPGELLTAKGVVLVTINYRLGRFGFFAHPALSEENNGVSGNQGLRDQVAALHWVRDNIAAFGGDAGNVTIFGESAGSQSVSLLHASPLARGLFHRVIGQSGGAFPADVAARGSHIVCGFVGIARRGIRAGVGRRGRRCVAVELADNAPRACPRRVPSQSSGFPNPVAVHRRWRSHSRGSGGDLRRWRTGRRAGADRLQRGRGHGLPGVLQTGLRRRRRGFNGYLQAALPEAVGQTAEAYPANDDQEAEQAWADLFADVLFTYPMRVWARSMENVASDAYLYWFTWWPPLENKEQLRAFHAAEIGYVFGDLELFGAKPTDEDLALSDLMANIWVQFAKTGNPNGPGLPEWPAYTRANEAYMELGKDTGAKTHLRMAQMELVERAWAARRAADAPSTEADEEVGGSEDA